MSQNNQKTAYGTTPMKKTPTTTPTNFTPRKFVKRTAQDQAKSPLQKSPRATYSQSSPSTSRTTSNQARKLSLQQMKNLASSPYTNVLSFEGKVVYLEPRKQIFDARVQYHRQRVIFADTQTFLITQMNSDEEEDPSNPKIGENMTNIITNFRVARKGEILIHKKSRADT